MEVDAAIQDEVSDERAVNLISTQVTTLSLKGNHLGSLSPKLAQLSALRVLDVSENGLTALPDEELPALDLPEFTTLNAGGNPREAAWKSSTLTPSSRPDV